LKAEEPPLPTPALVYVIDLPTALGLAERENPTIGIAREAIFANLALLQQARAELLPTLVAGGNLHFHRGVLMRDTGEILNVNSQSLYVGGGEGAIQTGTIAVPAIRIYAPLSNALFDPLVARQGVAVSRFEARATSNTVLLDVVLKYFELMGAQAARAAYLQSDADAARLTATVEAYVKVGQARQADADRAQTRRLLLRNQVYHADERVGVAAAQLARLLDLDPSVRLQTVQGPVRAIDIVDPSHDLAALTGIALRFRPEMAARNAAIGLTAARWQEERWRPWLPTISAGYSAGEFGGGSNLASPPAFENSGRNDFDVWAVWTLQNAGIGNRALQRTRQAEVDQATSERLRTMDRIQDEVAQAYGISAARRRQMAIAQQQLALAEAGFREELARTRGGVGLPIEVVNSLDLLARARQDFIAAIVEYDQAQFRLFVALGNPPGVALASAQSRPTLLTGEPAGHGIRERTVSAVIRSYDPPLPCSTGACHVRACWRKAASRPRGSRTA
jgi:outer membrane protein TolC